MPDTPSIDMEQWVCPAPLRDAPNIVMGHGGGGAMSGELVEHLFLPGFGAAATTELGDAAVVADPPPGVEHRRRVPRGDTPLD